MNVAHASRLSSCWFQILATKWQCLAFPLKYLRASSSFMSENNFSRNEILLSHESRQEFIHSSMRKSSVPEGRERTKETSNYTWNRPQFLQVCSRAVSLLFHSLKTIVDVETMAIKPFSTTAERKNWAIKFLMSAEALKMMIMMMMCVFRSRFKEKFIISIFKRISRSIASFCFRMENILVRRLSQF